MSETLKALAEVQAQLTWLQERIPGIVHSARAQGSTWSEIGQALGISPQGAQKRFRRPAETEEYGAGTAGSD